MDGAGQRINMDNNGNLPYIDESGLQSRGELTSAQNLKKGNFAL